MYSITIDRLLPSVRGKHSFLPRISKLLPKILGGRSHFSLKFWASLVPVIIPPTNFVCRGYTVFTLSVRPCVRPSVCPSVTLCYLNILKSHCWIFIKPCKHVHICKTNVLDKKVRARGQFYQSYFPL